MQKSTNTFQFAVTNSKKTLDSRSFLNKIIYVFIGLYILLFSYLSIAQHLGLKTTMNDLGNMTQAIYETLHGNFMRNSTFAAAEGQTNKILFAKHAFFTIILFVPQFSIFPNPIVLLVTQVIIVALGALPLYWLGLMLFQKRKWRAIVIPLAYLVNPVVHDATLFNFEPLVLAMSLVLFAFYFLHTKRYLWFYVFSALIALTKEDLPLTVCMFGVYMFFFQKERLKGVVVFGVALLYFFFVTSMLMPALAGIGYLPLLAGRYSHLGNNTMEIAKTVITKPLYILKYLITAENTIDITALFAPFIFIPLLVPQILLMATPAFLVNMLSSNHSMHYPFFYYYSSIVVAFVFLAGIFALKKLETFRAVLVTGKDIPAFILVTSLLFAFFLGPTPFSLNSTWAEFRVDGHARAVSRIVSMVPNESSISVQNNLGAHFAMRDDVFTFPYASDFADYVVLDAHDPNLVPRTALRARSFLVNIYAMPEIYYSYAEKLFVNKEYGVIYFSSDGYLVFKRGASQTKNNVAYDTFAENLKSSLSRYGYSTDFVKSLGTSGS